MITKEFDAILPELPANYDWLIQRKEVDGYSKVDIMILGKVDENYVYATKRLDVKLHTSPAYPEWRAVQNLTKAMYGWVFDMTGMK